MDVWKTVENAPKYEVSNFGNVRKIENGRLLHQSTDNYGYKLVSIFYGGEWKTKSVHRLVATAFIRNPKGNEQVNHKDGVKDNNHIDNLEWVTPAENLLHSIKVLGRKKPSKRTSQKGGDGMRTNLKVFRVGKKLSQEKFAKKCNVSRAVYSNIERGKTNPSLDFWNNLQREFDVPDEQMYPLMKLDSEVEQCEENEK